MEKYDLIVPLGEFCATAVALRDSGIRQASYPFDWSAGVEWNKCGNCGFLGKIQMICNEFEGAFNLEDLKEEIGENPDHRHVVNKRTGLQYIHDFDWDKNVSEQFPEYKEKYKRRVERLYTNIEKSRKILFIFITRTKHQLSLQEIWTGYKMLSKKFPRKNIYFLIAEDTLDEETSDIHFFKMKKNITIVQYHDFDGELGNQTVMQKILKTFIFDECEYNFATDPIINLGLSDKENWGRWSDGKYVWLKLPVYTEKSIKIKFDLMPYLIEDHPTKDVDVFLYGKKIAHWHFAMSKRFPETVLKVPAKKIKNGAIELIFKIKNPTNLSMKNSDGKIVRIRQLGIGFKTMKTMER